MKTHLLQKVIDFEIHLQNGFLSTFVMERNDECPRCRGRDVEINIGASMSPK